MLLRGRSLRLALLMPWKAAHLSRDGIGFASKSAVNPGANHVTLNWWFGWVVWTLRGTFPIFHLQKPPIKRNLSQRDLSNKNMKTKKPLYPPFLQLGLPTKRGVDIWETNP